MKVYLDEAPLRNGHAGRGIGSYTRHLRAALHALPGLELIDPSPTALKDADVVHYPYFDLYRASLKVPKRPTVVTVHDLIPLQFPEQYPAGVKGKLAFWRQRRALSAVEAIITDSVASKEAIVQYLALSPEKITVVPLAADPSLVRPADVLVNETLDQLALSRNYVLYVGDINYNKNVPQLIKAMKYLPEDVELVLAGKNFRPQQIPEWRAIETQVALSDVTRRVHFVPNIATGDSNRLAALYAAAGCYVQPSLAEGFGLPLLEALQVGTPVVSSNRTSLPEVGGTAIQYSEPEAESLAAAISEVFGYSAAKRTQVIAHGQDHAAQFTWQKTAEATRAVYQSIL